MLRRTILGAAASLAIASVRPVRAATVIHYPLPELNDHPWRFKHLEHYPIRLLDAALARSGHRYQLQSMPFKMTQSRALLELEAGRELDVMWTMTSRERERSLLPVRIPIYKGLIGWRLMLLRAQDRERFARVRNIDDLRRFSYLQGHDWPDTEILRKNGLKVQTSSDYSGMFKMLATGRADAFPRSLIEIWNEVEANSDLKLVVEPQLVLRYPTAFYYFVSRQNETLARDILTGLEKLIADGSFDRLFHEYHGEILQAVKLGQRHIIDIQNPLLPEETPLTRRELWFRA